MSPEKTASAEEKATAKPVAAAAPAEKPAPKKTSKQFFAAILVRGIIGARHDIKEALESLSLRRRHACVVIADTPTNRGQLIKAKDFITYGPISAETKAALDKIRGEKAVVNLHPPRGGWNSIKRGVKNGGALGGRVELDELITRMLP